MALGKCPQCFRGQVKEKDDGYRCDQPRCDFCIPKLLSGREIDPDEAGNLLDFEVLGQCPECVSGEVEKFVIGYRCSRKSCNFRVPGTMAALDELKLINGEFRQPKNPVSFAPWGLDTAEIEALLTQESYGTCPRCVSGLRKNSRGYSCWCGYTVPWYIAVSDIAPKVEKRSWGRVRADFHYGFVSRRNRKFWARVELKCWKLGKVSVCLKSDVGECSECDGGVVHVFPLGYQCAYCSYVVQSDNINPNIWPRDLAQGDCNQRHSRTSKIARFDPLEICTCPICSELIVKTSIGYECSSALCKFCLSHRVVEGALGRKFEDSTVCHLIHGVPWGEMYTYLNTPGGLVGVRLEEELGSRLNLVLSMPAEAFDRELKNR